MDDHQKSSTFPTRERLDKYSFISLCFGQALLSIYIFSSIYPNFVVAQINRETAIIVHIIS